MYGCCNCGDNIDLNQTHEICEECGGFCCDKDCLDEHECDPDGDL